MQGDPLPHHRLSLERILDASRTVDPVFLNSPQYRAEALEPERGFELVVKMETLNPIRSFKGRGADYFVGSLEPGTQIMCASAESRRWRTLAVNTDLAQVARKEFCLVRASQREETKVPGCRNTTSKV